MIEFENAFRWSLTELGEGMTTCFEDYIVPANFTPALLSFLARVDAMDFSESIIATEDGKMAGVLLICRRGNVSRVGAMAIAKGSRRQGLGTKMMDRAVAKCHERGDSKLVLEAIEQNESAVAFYVACGFRSRFRLIALRRELPSGGTEERLRDISFEELAGMIGARGDGAVSWEMSAATVSQFSHPFRAVACDGVGCAYSVGSEKELIFRAMALSGEGDPRRIERLLSALGARFPGYRVRVPPYFPEPEFRPALIGSGFELDPLSQLQFELPL